MLRFVFAIALFTLIGVTVATAAEPVESNLPRITLEQVRDYRTNHEAAWLAKIPDGRSRLYYFQEQWPEVVARIQKLDGRGAQWRQEFFAIADKIVATPVPPYDQMSKPGDTSDEWQRPIAENITSIALAIKLSDDPKYRAKLHDMVLAVCQYPCWGKGNNDLAAGHMAAALATAYDWDRSVFSANELDIIRQTVRERVPGLLRGLLGEKHWRNTYAWNHNHISTAGMGLAGLAFLGDIPEAGDWLAAACLNYQNIARYSAADGSSNEGVGYWTYGRSFIFKFVEGTKTVTDTGLLYDQPFLQNFISFRYGCASPGFLDTLRFADGKGDFCGPHEMLYRCASQYRDGHGQYLANHLPFSPRYGPTPGSYPWVLLWYDPTVQEVPLADLDYHGPDWEVVNTRSGWGAGDYMLSLKAGQNNDAHSHLANGALTFIFGKDWFLTTPGYGLGQHTPGFWERRGRRWNFLSNSTEGHSTLLINGKNQRSDDAARGVTDDLLFGVKNVWASANLTSAYDDTQSVRRSIYHRRGEYILILDDVSSSATVTAEWIAQVDPKTTLENGQLHYACSAGDIHLSMLAPAVAFAERAPARPNNDVAATTMKGFAAKAEGANLHLVAMLQPFFKNSPAPAIKTQVNHEAGVQRIVLNGESWQDTLWTREIAGNLGESPVTAVGNALLTRRTGGIVESILAVKATTVSTDAVRLALETPTTVALEKALGEAIIMTVGHDCRGSYQSPKNLKLFMDDNGRLITMPAATEPITLKAGRYILASDASAAMSAQRWISAANPSHNAE